ncbi:hypothetical protein EON65_28885 [archaeon]|nr:MAG: hypothetical protein EON65_28885 [archaeon]
MKYIGREFEFVDMANNWLGYQPRASVEELIAKKEKFIWHTAQAVKIQSILRRKFAHRIYWVRYRERLMTQVIPLFQAVVRGYFQRKRYRIIQQQLFLIKMATVIQSKWRKFFALHERIRIIKRQKFQVHCNKMALTIQSLYRGHIGRKKANKIRTQKVNENMLLARIAALREVRAKQIQRIYRGYVARTRVFQMFAQRKQQRQQRLKEIRCMRLIQRIGRGKIGRMRAQQRRQEITWWEFRWQCALHVQRVYRGHLGRLRFKFFLKQAIIRRRHLAATELQRHYRGYRGRLLAQVARALLALRVKQQFYAVELQRFLRGCMGRHYFKLHKDEKLKFKRMHFAARQVQRVYRGYKGREARDIERELQSLEHRATPLFTHLRTLEDKAGKLRHVIHRMEGLEHLQRENLKEIERELELCGRTASKYTDSSRITGVPQRFLTKFLKVRLQDHFEHEEVRGL